jgi:1-acyl-sn-glycerol-3-phosphate acyltransferase
MLSLFVPVRVEGERGRTGDVPRIFVFNHASFLDLFLITLAVPPDSAALAKGWPFKVPVYGPVMRLGGYVNVEEHFGEELLRRAALLLEQGVNLAVFPEGARSRTGELGRFRSGAFKLAIGAMTPVRPVVITGAGEVLAPGRYMLGLRAIRIRVLEDVSPALYSDVNLGHAAMRGYVRDAVRTARAAAMTTA